MSDNIIAMAKEAGFFVSGGWAYSSAGKGHHINESLSRFRDLVLEEAALVSFVESLVSGWDCDTDAHKYGTQCRKCEAAKLLAAAGAKP